MRPQLQKYINTPEEFGDCHRTCVAMVLNMDRDEVPHFMHDLPPGTPADDPKSQECERRELEWLEQHGLTFVNIPMPGETDVAHLLESLEVLTHGAPVVLGCRSPNGNHSVVVWNGHIYNPTNGLILGPMDDGFWWLTIYSVGPNWQTRAATRELAFRDGWDAATHQIANDCYDVDEAVRNYLQPPPAPPTVVGEQEVPSDGS